MYSPTGHLWRGRARKCWARCACSSADRWWLRGRRCPGHRRRGCRRKRWARCKSRGGRRTACNSPQRSWGSSWGRRPRWCCTRRCSSPLSWARPAGRSLWMPFFLYLFSLRPALPIALLFLLSASLEAQACASVRVDAYAPPSVGIFQRRNCGGSLRAPFTTCQSAAASCLVRSAHRPAVFKFQSTSWWRCLPAASPRRIAPVISSPGCGCCRRPELLRSK